MIRLISLLIAGVVAAPTAAMAQEPARDQARPNILFIAVDDLNDWIGALGGYPTPITPNIDRLAARGVIFTNAHAPAPACNPSRVALLTGVRPSTSGVYGNHDPWRPVMPDVVTLPQYFMKHGYEVVGRGKIFHGRYPDPASWHRYVDKLEDPLPPESKLEDPKTHAGNISFVPLELPDAEMDDHKVVTWASEFLSERRGDRPFFLAVGIYRPHMPWHVPQKYFDMHPLESIRLPTVLETDMADVPEAGRKIGNTGDHPRMLETGNWRRAVQGYLASMTFADAQIGRLLEALDRSPHRDNTIVVLWGDHGWHLGEKLRWRKFTLWEEATRTPLIFVAPGVTTAGTRADAPVDLMGLYPTLADLAGLPAPEVEGVTLRPLLEDAGAAWTRPALITWGPGNHAVRDHRWRYIRYADGSEELYDHAADPMEWTNLADRPEHARIKRDLARWMPD